MKSRLTKILCMILSIAVLVSELAACVGENGSNNEPTLYPTATSTPIEASADTGEGEPVSTGTAFVYPESKIVPGSVITVAYGANMSGDFIEGFGNNAYDLSIKTLMHHYAATIAMTPSEEFVLNTHYFDDMQIEEDAAGNKTYTFVLKQGIKWSDGSEITAHDYVASALWASSPQWVEAGAASGTGDSWLGYAAYNSGETDTFAGVKLLGDYEFSLTIDAENLPYFYEMAFVSLGPICKATYVPDIAIVSDENGAKFDSDILADCIRISETERFAPTVVSGPYTFVSFSSQICTLKYNEYFPGDFEGKMPQIETVVQMAVPEETDIDMLEAGQIDLLPAMMDVAKIYLATGTKINRALANPDLNISSYHRNGYGVINMVNNWGPTADPNVRWAIACLIDRNQLVEQVLDGYGSLVDCEAGQAQWMYQEMRADLQANLIPISFSLERANAYLDESEWKFEADGVTPFDASKANSDSTYMRHNADGEMLIINHAAASASVGNILEIEFVKNTPLAGMMYNFISPDVDVILNEYYKGMLLPDDERTYSTFSMGTNFETPYDPYYNNHSDWIMPYYNCTGLSDAELDDLIIKMRTTEPGDNETYLEHWYNYQIRWNQLLPNLPLYSNEYVNLFSSKLNGVPTTPFADWYAVICDIEIVG